VKCYICLNDDSTALDFWKEHETDLPLLSKMANIYSGISLSSVPVQSLFTFAGFLLNTTRSLMVPYNADRVTFTHNNYNVIIE